MKSNEKRLVILIALGFLVLFIFSNSNNSENKLNDVQEVPLPELSGNDNINIITPENKTYHGPMSGYFPATFGFESDLPGGDAKNWSHDIRPSTSSKIVDSYKGHERVYQLYDNAAGNPDTYTIFQNQSYGTIEFWILSTLNYSNFVFLRDHISDLPLIQLVLKNGGYVKVFNGSIYKETPESGILVENEWHHLRIDFRMVGTPAYMGLSDNSFVIYLNGVKSNTEFTLLTSSVKINKLVITTGWTAKDPNYYLYFDAVGFSWDPNYNVGDNRYEGILLSYESNMLLDWTVYSLDSKANKTILGNITISIPDLGVHTVQVFGTNNIGDGFRSELRYFTINGDAQPFANFTADRRTIDEGENVAFLFTGLEGNEPTTYYWDFGDGYTSLVQNPTHRYRFKDNYTVSLTVTDADGDNDSETKIDYIIVCKLKIHIDDLATGAGAHNWSWAEDQWWCDGIGTLDDPYIIENIEINGTSIIIENSEVLFIIRNCSVYNSSTGILMKNVIHGELINNNLSNNIIHGIYLLGDCDHNMIAGNNINNNKYGIYLNNSCYHNTILGNNISNNDYGLYLDDNCDGNTLSLNNINNNYHGIRLKNSCDGNTLSENAVKDNSIGILLLIDCNGNTISDNIAINNEAGISLQNTCDGNTISSNIAIDNDYGIALHIYCYNNTISGNTASKNLVGIAFGGYCHGNTISENTVNNNEIYGISLEKESNSNLYGNSVKDNDLGISLHGCKYNIISENIAGNNRGGIFLYIDCDGNFLIANTVNNNEEYGIRLDSGCDSNTIIGNTVNSNHDILAYGIHLRKYCTGNIISGNIANFNWQGITLKESHASIVSGNIILDNGWGISLLESQSNTISGNTVLNNSYGIYLFYSGLNMISKNTANYNYKNGIFFHSSNWNTVSENTVNYNRIGILLDRNCDFNTISGNKASNNLEYGIHLREYCTGNIISGNIANFNWQGITLKESHASIISGNIILDNGWGISLLESQSNTISGNIALNNFYGIYLFYSGLNMISKNTANYNYKNGIFFHSSDWNTVSENTVNYNRIGILLDRSCDFNTISGNKASNNLEYGIYLNLNCLSNIISANTVNNNGIGIFLALSCSLNTVSGNKASNNLFGISLVESYFNNVVLNFASDNTYYGIYVLYSNFNTFFLNVIINNGVSGIYSKCNNTYTGNTIQGNPIGIYLNNTFGGKYINNTFIENEVGFLCNNSNDIIVQENVFENNTGYAVIITQDSVNNSIYYNDFIENNNGGVQAYDESGETYWSDESGIGNYWSDYEERYPDTNTDQTFWTQSYELDGSVGASDEGSQLFSSEDVIGEILSELYNQLDNLEELININLKRGRKFACRAILYSSRKLIDYMVEQHLNDEEIHPIKICVLKLKLYLIHKIARDTEISELCCEILVLIDKLKVITDTSR